jgi:hypothetical protein
LSEEWFRIVTEQDRARLFSARHDAGICGGCGRTLDAGETVYLERFMVVRTYRWGPVGRECASPELLAVAEGTEPERCVWCGRGVYYGTSTRRRRQAICCRQCEGRAGNARQQSKEPG